MSDYANDVAKRYEAQIAELQSRLDSIRSIVLPAAVSSNSRDHVSAICELYKLFGEVVEIGRKNSDGAG